MSIYIGTDGRYHAEPDPVVPGKINIAFTPDAAPVEVIVDDVEKLLKVMEPFARVNDSPHSLGTLQITQLETGAHVADVEAADFRRLAEAYKEAMEGIKND